MIELNDIKRGKHTLSGIDYLTNYYKGWNSYGDGYIMIIDGKAVIAYENPDDGWRSYLVIQDGDIKDCRNRFPEQEVWIDFEDNENDWSKDEFMIISNIDTKEKIIVVGTRNYDDWYPCAYLEYHPGNLPINKK